ncbi:MAG: LEA type 2 family protein [Treponema sp.]|nr:LEA type 2 family protein [Treponema sp.]
MKNRIFFLPVLVFVFWSCRSFDHTTQEPAVSLNSVTIAGISFSGVDLIVAVDVENPNSFSIPMPDIDWELRVNEASFLQGSQRGRRSVRRWQTVTVALPVSFTFEGLYRSFASLVGLREAAYNIALGVSFPIPLMADKVFDFEFSGTFPLPQLPVLSLGQMRVSSIDISGIELAWDIIVENPNMFPIPFPSLTWGYNVGGVPVISGNFPGTGTIAAGSASVAAICASFVYADIFSALGSTINTGEVAGNLSLGITPAGIGFPQSALAGGGPVQTALSVPANIPIFQMPVVSFQGITRRALGFQRMEFALNLIVENRNVFPLDIDELNYEFRVNSNLWAGGRMDNPPRIQANGRTVISIPAVVSALPVVTELVTVISRGEAVTYSGTGKVSFVPEFPGKGKLDVPINFTGNTRILTP